MSSEGKVLKSRRAVWRHFEENAQPSSRLIPQPLQAQDADPSPRRSPGMQYFLRSHSSSSELRACRSRADILRAPAGSLGPKTESFRSAAVASVLSYPISTRARTNTFSAPFEALPDARPSALAAAQKLLPELPESCFVEMAGGPAAYAATPLRERQQSNLRTLCKAVGKNGDTGERLYSYIIKLKEYRLARQIGGDMWPLYPCILSNFAVWLQLNSPKEGATSVAPRCVSTFVSAASSMKLPVIIDSPHLGSVPAHQASGDGWTGFLPLDIVHEMFKVAAGDFSPGLLFDVRCACTIWMGSCRVQDWTQVSVAPKTFAPSADAVYKIKVTKNGERNTLFALGGDGVNGPVHWRGELDEQLRRFGACPSLSTSDYMDPSCNILPGQNVDAKSFAKRMMRVIEFCALRCGYTLQDLKDLHITPHSLHGSMAAYGEAMEWDTVPVHKLGRWKIPASPAAVVPAARRRGAGSGGPRTMPAVYSTAASCQNQLEIRSRMISAIRVIGSNFTTHGDLSCFSSNPVLADAGFRGPRGHDANFSPIANGVPVAIVK